MSRQLAISSVISVLAMAAVALWSPAPQRTAGRPAGHAPHAQFALR